MSPFHVVLALLPPILWATGYSIGKGSLNHFQPLFTTAMMYAIAGLCLFRPGGAVRTPWLWLLLISVIGCSIQSAFIFTGVALVDTSLANLVVQAQVPFAIIAASLLRLEKLSMWRMIGVVVAILGIVFVMGAPRTQSTLWGLALILAGTASWGLGQALIRSRSRDDVKQLVGVISLLAAPQLLFVSLLLERDHLELMATASLND